MPVSRQCAALLIAVALLAVELGVGLSADLQTNTCSGYPGIPGSPGNIGAPGRDGRDAKDGRDGGPGQKGEKGEKGERVQGPPGKAGPNGLLGPKGEKGERGFQGERGVQGPPGNAGPIGRLGPKGDKGEQGLQGAAFDPNLIAKLQSQVQTLQNSLSRLEKASQFLHWKRVGNKYLVSNKELGNFDKGLKICGDAGARIATPRNKVENDVLSKFLAESQTAYIGANDRKSEGRFVDLEEKPLGFTNWKNGEPNNYKNKEDCSTVDHNGQWNDVPCESNCMIICEF
ncbi:mannose-binding protein [Amia ocellicauda]|uniref:mannose-binding protein n=1 Tax=Amia ocellicauda TaxID=2972642 RepID=UPI003463C069